MKFAPKSPEELALAGLLPAGKYPFEVIKAEDKVSKASGNDMIALQLKVYGEGERSGIVFEYLMASNEQRLNQFCVATGLQDKYESGEMEAHDCTGRGGWVCIKIQPAKDGYEPKNVVSYYCGKPEASIAGATAGRLAPNSGALSMDEEDSIPF